MINKQLSVVKILTQEHLDWWDDLPELWKKIFHVALYYPEKIALTQYFMTHAIEDYCEEADNDYDAEGLFTVSLSNPQLKNPEDLLKLFQVKIIAFDTDINPCLENAVTHIPPMQYFTNLSFLSLSNNYLEDIGGLTGLSNLKYLKLQENFTLTSIEPLTTLTSLVYLDLAICHLEDITALQALTKLATLELWANRITDITSLVNLNRLTELSLGGNPIENIKPLAALKNLKSLSLGLGDEVRVGDKFDAANLDWLQDQLPDCEVELWQ